MTQVEQPETLPAPSSAWRWAPLLLVAVAWIAHGSVRGHGWVLDDVHLVRDNPLVARGPSAITEIFAGGASGAVEGVEHGSHGPVALASFALEAPLWRRADGSLKPVGFHLTNLLLHGLCVLLLFRFVLATWRGRALAALAAAVVFAAHPMHAGTVSALMGRAVILASLFGLLALLAWHRVRAGRAAWLAPALVLYLLAVFSHPAAVGLPLVAGMLAWRAPGARGWVRFAPLAFLLPLAAFLGAGGGRVWGAGDLPVQDVGMRLLLGCEGLVRTALLLVLPTGLRGDHGDEATAGVGFQADAATWVAVGLVCAAALAWLWQVRRGRAAAALAPFTAALALALPAASVLPAGATLELRWAYLVAMPLFLYVGRLAEAVRHAGGGSPAFVRARFAMVGGLVLVCLVGLSHAEADAWKDDTAFHETLLRRNPSHVRAMVRHANSRLRAAQRDRDDSTALRAGDPQRAFLLARAREALADADRWSQRAVRHELGRDDPIAWRVRGFVLLAGNRSANALRALETARDLDPALLRDPKEMVATYGPKRREGAARMYAGIARAREALGDRERAADAFAIAALLRPTDVDLLYRAGMALCRVNRYEEGLTLLLEARRLAGDPTRRREVDEAIRNAREAARRIAQRLIARGREAQGEGKHEVAVTLFEQATEVNPADVDAWTRAGRLRGWWFGNYETAERYFARAESILRKGKIPEDDPRWRLIQAFREELARQRAEED